MRRDAAFSRHSNGPSLAEQGSRGPVGSVLGRCAGVLRAGLERLYPWFASLLLHALLLVVLGLIVLSSPRRASITNLIATPADRFPDPVAVPLAPAAVQPQIRSTVEDLAQQTVAAPRIDAIAVDAAGVLMKETAASRAIPEAPGTRVRAQPGGFAGRSAAMRAELVAQRGGTAASEAAVERGLKWLAAHQLKDGSWRFDLRQSPQCRGLCRDHGTLPTTTGATALALLPFLGAGYTHQEGPYHETVSRGLYYLAGRAIVTPRGVDLQEGTMYAHGIATIAITEACAMTGDKALRELAQSAVDFTVHAQHPAGGWRYFPQQPGDTTVTGWQLMALKSAQLAGLHVPSTTWHAASRFLDSVQSEDGSRYGYQTRHPRMSTTAIGLLGRMYLGWRHRHPSLRRGIHVLAEHGPSPNDLYFNYYATQVLHHFEGRPWTRWNHAMRDMLVATQSDDRHEAGSWQFSEPHTRDAGRLYNTAMAIMILEVYYRYLPLYGREATLTAP